MHEASSTAPVVKPAWVFDLGYLAARTARAREEADGDVGNPMPAGTWGGWKAGEDRLLSTNCT